MKFYFPHKGLTRRYQNRIRFWRILAGRKYIIFKFNLLLYKGQKGFFGNQLRFLKILAVKK